MSNERINDPHDEHRGPGWIKKFLRKHNLGRSKYSISYWRVKRQEREWKRGS